MIAEDFFWPQKTRSTQGPTAQKPPWGLQTKQEYCTLAKRFWASCFSAGILTAASKHSFSPAQVLEEIQKPDMKFEYPDEEGFLYSCFRIMDFLPFFLIGGDDPDKTSVFHPAADVMQEFICDLCDGRLFSGDRCLAPICHCPKTLGR